MVPTTGIGMLMMKPPLFPPNYRDSALRATRDLKARILLRALASHIREALSSDQRSGLTVTVDAAPRILICDEAGEIAGRVTIDDESDLYVFCEFDDEATDIVIATASEDRLIEEITLHLCGGRHMRQPIDKAVAMLVGQTVEDVERKLVLQTLDYCNGDPTHTAFMLGMSLTTLCHKLTVYFAETVGELPQAAAGGGLGVNTYRL
ncbi:helix-turn-helix domain-containing protein [Rhizobium sp. P38BS-XIX]|uniref:helix-turn-helix domain-containing protein n=1 Tax=Rhizobium sp. P38BS-XIX TaxID=2726740 RepID=UPI001FEE3279|nr:helix-turn-helix domain-containing protein [Rhizobium sp. P38BS-XIX]